MRRSKESEAEAVTPAAPTLTPAALPRVRAAADAPSDVPGVSDLERGRTAALIATLGRVQLTLDLIERRLGRLEDDVREIKDAQETLAEAFLSSQDEVGVVAVVDVFEPAGGETEGLETEGLETDEPEADEADAPDVLQDGPETPAESH